MHQLALTAKAGAFPYIFNAVLGDSRRIASTNLWLATSMVNHRALIHDRDGAVSG